MAAKRLLYNFEVKKKAGKRVTIAGFSNASTVDRMKERIDPKGWILDNYDKNPVILFDHGHDPAFGFLPVGKSIKHVPQDDGLYTEAELSNSPTEKISAVRDLVEEGILKTFSVGFDPKDDTKDGDTLVITKAELLEQSIVPIPMNQDSVFSIMQKRLGKAANPQARRWFKNWSQKMDLCKKGAFTAALLHQRIADLEEIGNFDRTSALEHVGKLSGVNARTIKDILAGELTPIPDKVLASFAEVLRLNARFLIDVDKSDVALLERARTISTQEGKGMKKTAKKDGKAPSKKGAEFIVHMVMVPKEVFDETETASKFVEDNGYDAAKVSEDDQYYIFEQAPAEGLDLEKAQMFDLGDGVMAQVAPEAGEDVETPAEKPDAEDVAEGETDEEKAGDEEQTTEDKPEDKKSDEDKTDEQKSDEEKKDEKAAMDTTPPPDQNPILELMKQQVSMTGSLIEEIRKLTATLTGKTEKPADAAKEPEKSEDDAEEKSDEEHEKALIIQINKARDATIASLKRCGE